MEGFQDAVNDIEFVFDVGDFDDGCSDGFVFGWCVDAGPVGDDSFFGDGDCPAFFWWVGLVFGDFESEVAEDFGHVDDADLHVLFS